MTDWADIASFATAGGTLVLAVATFSAVRSANHSARIAERAFRIGLRPMLTASRLEDLPQRVLFGGGGDRHWVELHGGRAAVDVVDDVVYLAMLVRNAGNGMAMIDAWRVWDRSLAAEEGWDSDLVFRPQSRTLWISPGDVAFWQGALRDPTDPLSIAVRRAVAEGALSLDLLYSDHEGGQRTVSRFLLVRPEVDEESAGDGWWAQFTRHHLLDDD